MQNIKYFPSPFLSSYKNRETSTVTNYTNLARTTCQIGQLKPNKELKTVIVIKQERSFCTTCYINVMLVKITILLLTTFRQKLLNAVIPFATEIFCECF